MNLGQKLLLEFCRKCTSFYHVKKDEIPSLICNKCGQGVHDQCYKEITKAIYNFPGIIYLCAKCESPTPKVNVPTPTIEPSSQEDNLTQTESQVNPRDELIDQTICPKYRRGICPHGISGLTKVENKICEFYHPKRCMKLCIYGPHDEENGCNKGRDCELFHPIICRYSLKYKRCINRSCRFTHLRGTRRYRSRHEETPHVNGNPDQVDKQVEVNPTKESVNLISQQPKDQDKGNESSNQVVENPTQPTTSTQSNNVPFLSELLQIIQQMKEMKREIKEVREMQMYRPPIPAMFPSVPYQLLNQQNQHVSAIPDQSHVQHRPPQMPIFQHTQVMSPQQHNQMTPQQSNPVMPVNALQNTTQNNLQ